MIKLGTRLVIFMEETVLVALISGSLTLLGTIITVYSSTRKMDNNLKVAHAVTETKLEALTTEVRKHNNFATRIPVIENDIENLYDKVDSLEKKIG